jgi:hypothetical protein
MTEFRPIFPKPMSASHPFLSGAQGTLFLQSALEVCSCLIFVGSLHLLLVPETLPDFFTNLVYLGVVVSEFLKWFTRASSFESKSSLPLRIWLSPRFHNITVALFFLLLRLKFSAYFVAQLFSTFLNVVVLLKSEIGSRIPELGQPLIRLFDWLELAIDFRQVAVLSEIFLAFQISFSGLVTRNWATVLAFPFYFVFHTLYNMVAHANHQKVYVRFGQILQRIAPDSRTLWGKVASRLMARIWKVKAAARKLYPMPISDDQ